MSKPIISINLAVACYFIVAIAYHFIRPGQDFDYTKALLLNLILMPVFGFLLAIIPNMKEHVFSGIALIIMALGMAVVTAVATLGLRGGFWLVLYLYPIVSLVASKGTTTNDQIVQLTLTYFGAFFAALILFGIFSAFSISFAEQRIHFNKVWENYSDGVTIMLVASLFAIFNQIPVIRDALSKLL